MSFSSIFFNGLSLVAHIRYTLYQTYVFSRLNLSSTVPISVLLSRYSTFDFTDYLYISFVFAPSICLFVCFSFFTSDVHQPLSQIRISLASSLGAGQLIFLAGIDATGNTVREFYSFAEFHLL